MNVLKIDTLKKKSAFLGKISLLILIVAGACSPVAPASAPVEPQPTQTPVVPSPTLEPTTIPTAVAAEELIYPAYLPLVTNLENVSQTIDGVTTKIDWAYADGSRVAIQYTISGLEWPNGTMLDNMQQVVMNIPALSDFRFGGFSGGGGATVSPVEQGVVVGISDQALLDGALDAEKNPEIQVNVDIPVVGSTTIGTFHLSFKVPVRNGSKIENIDQTVTTNQISMTLKSVILNPSHAKALLCFQMPSAVDWGLSASTLTMGDQEYKVSTLELATDKSDPRSALNSAERCSAVGFEVRYDESITSIELTVPRLQASSTEVVTEESVNRANERLANQGIQFDYVNVDHGGNIVLLQQPTGLSDAEIYTLIWDALAEQYEGPWVFTVPIPK